MLELIRAQAVSCQQNSKADADGAVSQYDLMLPFGDFLGQAKIKHSGASSSTLQSTALFFSESNTSSKFGVIVRHQYAVCSSFTLAASPPPTHQFVKLTPACHLRPCHKPLLDLSSKYKSQFTTSVHLIFYRFTTRAVSEYFKM